MTGVIAVAQSVPPDQTLDTTIAAATALTAAIVRVTGLNPLRDGGAGGGLGYWRVRESAGMVETRGDAGVSTVAGPCYESSRPSAAAATASATSARGASEARRTYSCGACAPPPRGPRPSIVTGMAEAKCAASLAPPRPAATIGRPSSAQARCST